MGGGFEGEARMKGLHIHCQLCKNAGHEADDCHLFCPPCPEPACRGRMKLKTSRTVKNPGRKFWRCDFGTCQGFAWFEEDGADLGSYSHTKAAQANSSTGSGSRCRWGSSSRSGDICYYCGLQGHWKEDCPWSDEKCETCGNLKVLKTSTKEKSKGSKFFKCDGCGKFEWFNSVVKDVSKNNLKITVEGNVNDICSLFAKHVTLRK